jgi:hypothetical protein
MPWRQILIFFKGTNQDGAGPAPHFIMMSFIKDKTRIKDQLITALTSTVSILCAHFPDTLINCIQKGRKPPPSLQPRVTTLRPLACMLGIICLFRTLCPSIPGFKTSPNFPHRNLVKMDDRCLMGIGDTIEKIESQPSCGYLHHVMSKRL